MTNDELFSGQHFAILVMFSSLGPIVFFVLPDKGCIKASFPSGKGEETVAESLGNLLEGDKYCKIRKTAPMVPAGLAWSPHTEVGARPGGGDNVSLGAGCKEVLSSQ